MRSRHGCRYSVRVSMNLDVTQSLKDTENSLRDFIASVLEKANGPEWYNSCGVSPDRVEKWEERRDVELKRQRAGSVDPRLIYYADFYDLGTIIEKNWSCFKDVFDDLSRLRVYLRDLEKLRDPDAHRRELLPHQRHLVLGIGGEIRARIIQYRNKLDTIDAYFPRIESARDSLGNVYVPGEFRPPVNAQQILRPDDVIDFTVTASDPLGATLSYRIAINDFERSDWQEDNSFSVRIREEHIGKYFSVAIHVRSPRDHHARAGSYDDKVEFDYTVLPRKKS
jgi:hypothetical protein